MKNFYHLEKIEKKYEDTSYTIQVLQELDLSIDTGDMIAITGTSGSGKSTLLHIMGLLDIPTTGRIYFQGEEISANMKNAEMFRNTHIGFVFQFHYLLADFSAVENVALPAVIAGAPFGTAKQKATDLLTELNMQQRLHHYPNQLSGGEQQRVSIARAMINSPSIIIADEPTGNLDRKHAHEIIDIFHRLNKERGQSIILATHDLDIANSMKKHYCLHDYKLLLRENN
jgi:ABC-type lipoprotein export system ATPase subunit